MEKDLRRDNVVVEPYEFGIKLSNSHGSMLVSIVDGAPVIHDLNGDGLSGGLIPELAAVAENILKEAGFTDVLVHVASDKTRLIDLYQKRWGFEPAAVVLKKELGR